MGGYCLSVVELLVTDGSRQRKDSLGVYSIMSTADTPILCMAFLYYASSLPNLPQRLLQHNVSSPLDGDSHQLANWCQSTGSTARCLEFANYCLFSPLLAKCRHHIPRQRFSLPVSILQPWYGVHLFFRHSLAPGRSTPVPQHQASNLMQATEI